MESHSNCLPCLAYSTEQHVLKVPPGWRRCQRFLPFSGLSDIPRCAWTTFAYPVTHGWTLGLFHALVIVNTVVLNMGVHMSVSCFQFLWLHAQEWDCWILWLFCLSFQGTLISVSFVQHFAQVKAGPGGPGHWLLHRVSFLSLMGGAEEELRIPLNGAGRGERDLPSPGPPGALLMPSSPVSMVPATSLCSSVRPQDGSVLNTSPPPPEEPSRAPPDDRKDLPWGAQFELPPMLLDTER